MPATSLPIVDLFPTFPLLEWCVDDLTELEAVNLKTLVPIEPFIGPLNYHERFGLAFPPEASVLQHKLKDIQKFTEDNMMLPFFRKVYPDIVHSSLRLFT